MIQAGHFRIYKAHPLPGASVLRFLGEEGRGRTTTIVGKDARDCKMCIRIKEEFHSIIKQTKMKSPECIVEIYLA
jgi:hypothetical protein